MSEQQYEYTIRKIDDNLRGDAAQTALDEMSSDGWRLVERVDVSGTTSQFIFERPV